MLPNFNSLSINFKSFIDNQASAYPFFSFLTKEEVASSSRVSTVFKEAVNKYKQSLSTDLRINTRSLTSEANELLKLINNHITKKTFVDAPLFKDAKEKEDVFNELVRITKEENFFVEYKNFLSILDRKDWFGVCKNNPIKSSHFSILAFLDGKINEGELFVIHAVAKAYEDQKKNLNDGSIGVIDVQPIVLEVDEIIEYLKKSFFDFEGMPPSMLSNSRTFDLDDAKDEFLKKIKEKSYIERTFLECTLSPFHSSHSKVINSNERDTAKLSVFTIICLKSKSEVGFKAKELMYNPDDKAIAVLPSVSLVVDLLRATSKFGEKLFDPVFMFGHAMRYDVLYGGRPITGASCLFRVRAPHGYKTGPLRLGMYFHDLCYHLFLDTNNPHVEILIEIGKKLLGACKLVPFRRFAGEVLDREAFEYRKYRPKDAFWKFLIDKLSKLKREVSLEDFDKYFKEVFFPLISEVLNNYSMKENHISITEMSMEKVLNELEKR